MTAFVRKRHVVPTHVHTPETVLTIGGITLSARQFLLLLIGTALSYNLWKHLAWVTFLPAGLVLAGMLAALPLVLALALAFGLLAGRSLEAWGLVMVRYLVRPRRQIWRSVRFQDTRAEGEAQDA